jgi:AAT family amino acid transporter
MPAESTPAHHPTATARRRKSLPWWGFGLANLVVILILALGSWYLLIDPAWSPLATYPFPFEEVLFWAILLVVFFGFNLEFYGFDRIPQPWRGLALIAVTVALAIALTALMGVWGKFDPAFAVGRSGGNGYLTPALYVLFGFFTYLTVVINWGHWPWRHKGLGQPSVGFAEIVAVTAPTVVAFLAFVVPNEASWATPGHNLLGLTTTIGWVYDIIVIAIITGLLTDNWPWRLAGPGGRNAAASLVGNIVVGTGLYFAFLALSKAILGGAAVAALGPDVTKFPAEMGVCWVFWMILWSNAFHNWPNKRNAAVNYVARIVITLALGIATFAFYYYVFGRFVTHEPLVGGGAHGDALGWMNWMILWILFYVVYLGSYGIPGHPEESADETQQPIGEHVADVTMDESAS